MNKYVIELRPDCKVVQQICESNGQVCIGARSIQYLEELTADYINEHFGSLQDTAYKKGFEDGQNQNEAWKYARKIACVPQNGGMDRAWLDAIFGSALDRSEILFTFSAKNAIEMIKAYEKKQADKIGVGDVVKTYNGITFVVTRVTIDGTVIGFAGDGSTCRFALSEVTNKGRHYNINEILGGLCDD